MVRAAIASLGALLLVGGCGSGEHAASTVSIVAEASAATVTCVDTTTGLCHLAFATPTPLRADIGKGQQRRFAGVTPGTALCVEAEPVDLVRCNRILIRQGTQKIARSRVVG